MCDQPWPPKRQSAASARACAGGLGAKDYTPVDSLRGSSVKLGTMQRRLAWPLRKDDTHKS